MDEHDLKIMQNAILPDIIKMMVQNFQKRLKKLYKSKEYLKCLMITQQN
jgi:hypothetical protein